MNADTRTATPWWIPLVILLGSAFLVYAGCFGHEFLSLWDDGDYILKNEAVRGVTLHNLKLAFSSFYVGNYAPLQIISYMIDFSVWGLSPAGFIGTNIVLHGLNGYLLFLLLVRSGGSRNAALFAALFFVLHPVQVESVAWVSERKNLLALFFMLLAMVWYADYSCRIRSSGSARFAYGLALLFFSLALLTKSVVVVLPLLLAGWDCLLKGKKDWKKLLKDTAPFLLLSIAFSAVTLYTQGVEMGGGRLPVNARPLWITILTMLPVLTTYLKMIVLPLSLSPWYDPVVRTTVDLQVFLSLAVLAVIVFASLKMAKKGLRNELYWTGVFFAGLLPVSNIIPLVTMMNDRYLYLPMIGVAGIVCCLLSRYSGKMTGSIAAVTVLLLLSLFSFKQTSVWKNNLSLWNAAYRHYPESIPVIVHLARSYKSVGMTEKASDLLNQALVGQPDNTEVLFRLGELMLDSGDLDRAKRYLDRLYRLQPRHFEGLLALGREAFLRGSHGEAGRYFGEALALKPGDVTALIWMSNLCQETGNTAEARTLLLKALPGAGLLDRAGIFYSLALAELREGSSEKSLEWLEKAVSAGFDDWETLQGNEDFDAVRSDTRFRELVKAMEKAAGR